jgi:hypothetical protein
MWYVSEGLWLKNQSYSLAREISFYTMIAQFIAHKTPYYDTYDCIQNPTTFHLWLHIKTLPLDTLYLELLLFCIQEPKIYTCKV